MVVSEELVQEVNGIVTDKALVISVDETMPVLLGESAQNVVVLSIELDIVLVKVVEQVFGTENLGDLDELVRIAVSVEERLFAEDLPTQAEPKDDQHKREEGEEEGEEEGGAN